MYVVAKNWPSEPSVGFFESLGLLTFNTMLSEPLFDQTKTLLNFKTCTIPVIHNNPVYVTPWRSLTLSVSNLMFVAMVCALKSNMMEYSLIEIPYKSTLNSLSQLTPGSTTMFCFYGVSPKSKRNSNSKQIQLKTSKTTHEFTFLLATLVALHFTPVRKSVGGRSFGLQPSSVAWSLRACFIIFRCLMKMCAVKF